MTIIFQKSTLDLFSPELMFLFMCYLSFETTKLNDSLYVILRCKYKSVCVYRGTNICGGYQCAQDKDIDHLMPLQQAHALVLELLDAS